MQLRDALQQEIVLWVDFNNLEDDERLPTTMRYAAGPRKPVKGDLVRIVDSDGNTCLAWVLRVEGMLVEVKPEWSTWATPITLGTVSGLSPFPRPKRQGTIQAADKPAAKEVAPVSVIEHTA